MLLSHVSQFSPDEVKTSQKCNGDIFNKRHKKVGVSILFVILFSFTVF